MSMRRSASTYVVAMSSAADADRALCACERLAVRRKAGGCGAYPCFLLGLESCCVKWQSEIGPDTSESYIG